MAAGGAAQDAALAAAERLLAPDLALVEVLTGPVRLGVFREVRSGALLHLLPGARAAWLGQEGGLPQEAPPRRCALAPLLVGRAPLRQEEWDRLGGAPGTCPVRGPDLPVAGVSWFAAREGLARVGLRLPREDEWEWACRAGGRAPWWWGASFDPDRCWYLDNAGRAPQPVARHAAQANPFGLIDLHGNVAEWCLDALDVPPEGSAWQEWDPGRVHRGGSFEQPSRPTRASFRTGCDPARAYPDLGLRAFRSLLPPPGEGRADQAPGAGAAGVSGRC